VDHWVARAAAMEPERPAVGTMKYADLHAAASAAAGALVERGVSPGDRVALALPPGEEFAVALHGCMLAGAVAVPIDLRLGEMELAARAAGAIAYIDGGIGGAAPGEPWPLTLEAAATVMHTSGTTAAPRPVALTYGNWLASSLASAVALGLDPRERWLCPLPLVHVGGLSILIRSAIYGTSVVLHSRFDADVVAGALMDPGEAITLVSLVPTMLARLLDAGLTRPPTLRWALLGGGPIAPALLERAARAGVPVASTYGMTEACSQIATGGWPLVCVDVRVAKDGEVLVRGPNVSPEALTDDGWLHTGDLGTLDARGRLTVTSRKAETIITGGENVAPAEVEAVLLEHPAVADAGVFARPDAEWGEALIAAVVVRDGVAITAEELRSHCAARLASFKVPKTVEFARRLPRTDTGKLVRRELGVPEQRETT
jgi:O-succinylbenzoic acid--CoA ligase